MSSNKARVIRLERFFGVSVKDLFKLYKVSTTSILNIVNDKAWVGDVL
jgi:hypothetical protein